MSKLDAALQAARKGFRVFPLVPNAKTPAFEAWQTAATADERRIGQWWAPGNRDYNIGILLDGLAAVDVDPKNGGKDTFLALAKELGFDQDDNKTLLAETASGGHHFIYKLPDGLRLKSRAHQFGQGVDLKTGAGAYIVAAGSTIDGNAYKWVNDRPVRELLPGLVERAQVAKERSPDAGKRLVEEDDWAIERAEAWLHRAAPAAEQGERDNVAFGVAARLYDFGVSEETALDLLAAWNAERCSPPLEIEALMRVSRSATRNRNKPIGTEHPDNASGFEPQGGAPHPFEGDGFAQPQKPQRAKLFYLTPEQCQAKLSEPRARHLIDGLIPARAMVVTYGESSQGKSFHAMDRYMHVAGNIAWCGRAVSPGGVVWVAAELSDDLYARIEAVKQKLELDNAVPFFAVPCPVDLLRANGDTKPLIALVKQIEAEREIKVAAVVVDTLSRALAGGNENAPDDMGAFVQHTDAIRYQCDCTVEIIHHSGKDTAKGARGHSLLRAATDTEIEVGGGAIRLTKQRSGESDKRWDFRLHQRRVGIDHEGREIVSCYVETRAADGKGSAGWRLGLTAKEQELYDKLAAISGEHPNGFTWETVAVVCRGPDPDKLPSRSTVVGRLSELVGKGWMRKDKRGQYVMSLSGFVGKADSRQDQ